MPEPGGIQRGIQHSNVTLEAMRELQQEAKADRLAQSVASKSALQESLQETTYHLAGKVRKKDKPIKAHKTRIQKMMKSGEKMQRLLPIEQLKDSAHQFQQRNRELKAETLVNLRGEIKPGDSKEEILAKIQKYYPDVTLTDEVLEFLLDTTEGELHNSIRELKEEFAEQHQREITAGRNIQKEAQSASDKGLGTPTSLRDQYRDITGNPRDANTLFNELSQKHDFKDLKKMVDFFLHSLGSDLKAKGPSIPRGELHRLLSETRTMQAILGVYRFFNSRMGLMHSLFQKAGIDFPKKLTFELMSKQFMSFISERYPSSNKALQTAVKLGLEKWLIAKIIALSQFRDAIREVALQKIYKSLQHRDECFLALIEALEDLEDELEELLEREEEDEEEEEEGEEEEEEEE